jgi:hypothetical protein
MRQRPTVVLLAGLLTATPALAQEIVQAVVLDLTVVEVQVIVAGTRGDEQVQCLVRGVDGHVRAVASQPVSGGLASGRTTILSLPLPLLSPQEKEFAVALLRRGTVLDQTDWRVLFQQ